MQNKSTYNCNLLYCDFAKCSGGTLIPESIGKPGHLYTTSYGKSGQLGTFKLKMTPGNGKFERTGISSDRDAR